MAIGPKLKPGKDLMAKEALRDPKVVNLITESLVKTTDDYFIGNCEWRDGTRSDMVLEPKNAHSDLPPLIVDIQHTVNKAFMKRAISYCLQAFTRYHKEPTILIICVEKLNQDNIHVKLSKLPGVFSYFSEPWAEHCYIISKESTKDNLSIPLHPLVALGSFFTNRCLRRKVQGVCLQKTCERIAFCHLMALSATHSNLPSPEVITFWKLSLYVSNNGASRHSRYDDHFRRGECCYQSSITLA